MKAGKRALLMSAALAALLPFGVNTVAAKTVDAPTQIVDRGTAIDAVIDVAVQLQVTAGNLTAAGAAVYREQLQSQFESLSATQQRSIVDAASKGSAPGAIFDVVALLNNAIKAGAEQALAETQTARTNSDQSQEIQQKLGGDGDLVYVALAGPCRVADSRFGPGQLAPGSARQLWALSNGPGYLWSGQGGTGDSSSGNCIGSTFTGMLPTAAVATVTVVNTVASGALQAWNGGTTLSGGAVVNWNAGDRLSNTTIIPVNRSISPYPGSGSKRDIALNNNSGAGIDYVVDVIGYFIENRATALECTTLTSAAYAVPVGANVAGASPACAAGFTRVVTTCFPAHYTNHNIGTSSSTCYFENTGIASSFTATSVCCRVPGR